MHRFKSTIWEQSEAEIIRWPYEYKEQKQFLREAVQYIDETITLFEQFNGKFKAFDHSLEKAQWMLHLHALSIFQDCLFLMKHKKHRIAGKMFRDVTEILALSQLLLIKPGKLKAWFDGKIITHRDFRNTQRTLNKFNTGETYKNLSKWTHNNYKNLLKSYSLGVNDQIFYDGFDEMLILPHTIAQYLWVIGKLIIYSSSIIVESPLLSKKEKNLIKIKIKKKA